MDALDRLREQLDLIDALHHAGALLGWDRETKLPPGASALRGRAMGGLSRVAHEMATSADFGRSLEAAEREGASLDPDGDDARLLAVTRRDFDRATRIPAPFVADLRQAGSAGMEAWIRARDADDFALLAPALERMVALQRELVEYLGYDEHPYDALLDTHEPNFSTARTRAVLDELRTRTVPLLRRIVDSGIEVDDGFLHQPFDHDEQWALAHELVEYLDFDMARGRIDPTHHPFCAPISPDDVRITTRVDPDFFNSCFFATAHECGHALHAQGLPAHLSGTPLVDSASAAIGESQARLWENVVARSEPFLRHFYPRIQSRFAAQLGDVPVEAFYRAVNRVSPSLNRVEADELTYNLHIILRFELEVGLIEGTIEVDELPGLWTEKMEALLGVVPAGDREGVLQDMHWASGLFGYFPTYTLGNVISLQLYHAALEEHPEIPGHIADGDSALLLAWMRDHVHRHGRKFLPEEILQRATGRALTADPYVDYLERKYAALYALDPQEA